jgi:hypothetical protein
MSFRVNNKSVDNIGIFDSYENSTEENILHKRNKFLNRIFNTLYSIEIKALQAVLINFSIFFKLRPYLYPDGIRTHDPLIHCQKGYQ